MPRRSLQLCRPGHPDLAQLAVCHETGFPAAGGDGIDLDPFEEELHDMLSHSN